MRNAQLIKKSFNEDTTKGPDKGMNILIIGGGDGRVTKQLIEMYDDIINKIIIVEIDIEVSNVCKEQFQDDTLFDHPKLEWIYEDAILWVKNNQKQAATFDACIIDSTDPTIGISIGLFCKSFYSDLKVLLKEGAHVSQQCDTNEENYKQLIPIFKECDLSYVETKKFPTIEQTGETHVIIFKN